MCIDRSSETRAARYPDPDGRPLTVLCSVPCACVSTSRPETLEVRVEVEVEVEERLLRGRAEVGAVWVRARLGRQRGRGE